MSWGTRVWVSAVIAFVMGGGAFLTGVMLGKEALVLPSAAGWVLAVVTGAIAAAKDLQSKISEPPK